jgi:hypothetical protein
MVTANVDNDPVSVQLNGASFTVPSNQVVKVNIVVHGGVNQSILEINGNTATKSSNNLSNPHPPEFTMVLTGGDTVAETEGNQDSLVTVQGFVVDN